MNHAGDTDVASATSLQKSLLRFRQVANSAVHIAESRVGDGANLFFKLFAKHKQHADDSRDDQNVLNRTLSSSLVLKCFFHVRTPLNVQLFIGQYAQILKSLYFNYYFLVNRVKIA